MPVIKRIMCPVDFSDTAALGAREAAVLARAAGAELMLVHALQEPWLGQRHEHGYTAPVAQQYEMLAQKKLNDAARALRSLATVRTLLVHGTAEEAIAQAAIKHSADLIVMGTRARSGLARLLTDGMTERVMKRVRVPVVRVCPSARRPSHVRTSAHGMA
jgi:universal stress protein A